MQLSGASAPRAPGGVKARAAAVVFRLFSTLRPPHGNDTCLKHSAVLVVPATDDQKHGSRAPLERVHISTTGHRSFLVHDDAEDPQAAPSGPTLSSSDQQAEASSRAKLRAAPRFSGRLRHFVTAFSKSKQPSPGGSSSSSSSDQTAGAVETLVARPADQEEQQNGQEGRSSLTSDSASSSMMGTAGLSTLAPSSFAQQPHGTVQVAALSAASHGHKDEASCPTATPAAVAAADLQQHSQAVTVAKGLEIGFRALKPKPTPIARQDISKQPGQQQIEQQLHKGQKQQQTPPVLTFDALKYRHRRYFKAAGTLFYTFNPHQKKVHLLMSWLDSGKGPSVESEKWTFLGGKREAKETPEVTAAREAEEETRGVLCREKVHAALQQAPSFWYSKGGYLLFLAEVPFEQGWDLPDRMDAATGGKPGKFPNTRLGWLPLQQVLQQSKQRPLKSPLYKLVRFLFKDVAQLTGALALVEQHYAGQVVSSKLVASVDLGPIDSSSSSSGGGGGGSGGSSSNCSDSDSGSSGCDGGHASSNHAALGAAKQPAASWLDWDDGPIDIEYLVQTGQLIEIV